MKSKIKIERILYPKNVNTTNTGEFSIFTAKVIDHMEGEEPVIHDIYRTITLKGIVPKIKKDDEFVVIYDNPETNKFGTSYELLTITKEVDKNNKEQVKEYLELVCGKQIAKELLQYEDALGMLERKETDKLLKVKGIGTKKLKFIYDNMAQMGDYSLAYTELMKYGLTKKTIVKICRAYGSAESAIHICKNNPYDLIRKINGISFKIADDIAIKCGLDMSSDIRVESAIQYVLEDSGRSGKSYLFTNQFINVITNIVSVDESILKRVLEKMKNEGKIMLLNNNTEIALPYYFELEKQIAQEFKRIATADSDIEIPLNWKEIIKGIETEQGWQHTDEQWKGIETVLKNNVTIVTGKAGTGKSTITNAMCRVLSDYEIKMTCLSAKAAQRITQVTQKQASTIHKLLNLNVSDEKNPTPTTIYADIVILDEASMVSGELFLLLLKSIRSGTKLIILGDDGQLQAIGDCAVFSDLLSSRSKLLPVIELTKIHRQAQASAIITKSIDVRNQKALYPPKFRGYSRLGELQDLELFIKDNKEELLENLVCEFFNNLQLVGDIFEVQIITAMKNRGELCTNNINKVIQKLYNKNAAYKNRNEYLTSLDVLILEGDKVINRKNNYDMETVNGESVSIHNGDIGEVVSISEDTIIVNFNEMLIKIEGSDRNYLDLAYAITVHSSQGSQWERVICTFDTSMWVLLNVEMLYTAMSRASKHCVIIAEDKAIKQSIRTVEQRTKQTYLNRFLYYL